MSAPAQGRATDPVAPRRPPNGSLLRDVAVVAGVVLLVSVVVGVAWWLLVEPAAFQVLDGRVVMSELELSRRFAADGWYVALSVAGGLLAGAVLTTWRSSRPLVTLLVGIAAAVLGGLIAVRIGGFLGADPDQVRAAGRAAREGARIPAPLELSWSTERWSLAFGYVLGALSSLLGFGPRRRPRREQPR